MAYIREGGRQVEKKFADVLKFCWEGLLYEYLRSVGCPLRDREHDPRHFVMRYWRRSMLDPTVQPGFVPYYAKREVRDEQASVILFQSGLTTAVMAHLSALAPRRLRVQVQRAEVAAVHV